MSYASFLVLCPISLMSLYHSTTESNPRELIVLANTETA
jgi:hypothetical protein